MKSRSSAALTAVALAAVIAWVSQTVAARERGQSAPAPKVASVAQAAIPEAFDSTDCKACHEPAVTKLEQTHHGNLEQSCATCHDRAKSIAHSKGRAEGQEVPGPSVKAMKPREVNTMCLGCHEKSRQASWMGGKHETRNVACTSCHSVHTFKSTKAQLKHPTDAETCVGCHKSEKAQLLRTAHHPVREGKMGCVSCHDPHDGTRPKMLVAESTNELCYKCHTEKRGPFLFEHAAVREDCTSCHAPHGSNHERMIVAKPPFLCQRCHYSGHGITGDLANTAAGSPVAPPAVGGVNQTTRSSRQQERSCKQCHVAIHGSNHPSGNFLLR